MCSVDFLALGLNQFKSKKKLWLLKLLFSSPSFLSTDIPSNHSSTRYTGWSGNRTCYYSSRLSVSSITEASEACIYLDSGIMKGTQSVIAQAPKKEPMRIIIGVIGFVSAWCSADVTKRVSEGSGGYIEEMGCQWANAQHELYDDGEWSKAWYCRALTVRWQSRANSGGDAHFDCYLWQLFILRACVYSSAI